eukprot:gene3796-47337_t
MKREPNLFNGNTASTARGNERGDGATVIPPAAAPAPRRRADPTG